MAYIITADVNVRCKLAVGAYDPADAKRRAAANLRRLIVDGSGFTAETALLDEKKVSFSCCRMKKIRKRPQQIKSFRHINSLDRGQKNLRTHH